MSEKTSGCPLGMDRKIDRRDFLNGMAVTAAALASPLPAEGGITPTTQDASGYYPPLSHGLRGSHPGSFETAHNLRDGSFWNRAKKPQDTHAVYDLVVVGGGISGLSAAHFFRVKKPNAKILILDNHDDFGGHAKRNEYHLNGRLELMNGGTLLIDSPQPYSAAASGLIKHLGIDPVALTKQCDKPEIYKGLTAATFFDRQTFGEDRLVVGRERTDEHGGTISWKDFLAKSPLDAATRAEILRVQEGTVDSMPGVTSDQKKDRLSRISYFVYLRDYMKCGSKAVAFYQTITHDEWGTGIDAVPALDCKNFRRENRWDMEDSCFSVTPQSTSRISIHHDCNSRASLSKWRILSEAPAPGASSAPAASSKANHSPHDLPVRRATASLLSTRTRRRGI
jgi:spermidine dehydrogenase